MIEIHIQGKSAIVDLIGILDTSKVMKSVSRSFDFRRYLIRFILFCGFILLFFFFSDGCGSLVVVWSCD